VELADATIDQGVRLRLLEMANAWLKLARQADTTKGAGQTSTRSPRPPTHGGDGASMQ
jgi:hypothetical protein